MAFLFSLFGGGKSKTTIPPAVSGLQLQTSNLGSPVQIVYGTTRIAPNLIWYGDFKSHPIKSKSSGKGGIVGGGGKGSTTTGYSYTTAVILGLCEGPIESVETVYVNKDVSTLSALGLTLFTGSYSQSPWSYLTTNHPGEALNYRGIAYLAANNYNLGTSPQLPNHNFEVKGVFSASLNALGVVDADPSLVINDLLTNAHYGVGFPPSRVGSLSVYQAYTVANGLWVSPAYNLQSQASVILDELAAATNSAFVWSNGILNLVPYGDVNITANGYTYTAPSAPLYSIAETDFQPNRNAAGGAVGTEQNDPVALLRKRPADQINSLKIECLDRSARYNPAIIEAKDQAAIDAFGLRQAPSKQAHLFADTTAARLSVQLQLQRQGIRNVYQFTLDQRYVVLDPMDIIEITDAGLGITNQWVRIKEVVEQDDWTITFTVEEYLAGTGNAPIYNFQKSGGATPSSTCDPGPTYAVLTDVPLCLDANAPAVWIAAGGPGGGFNAQKVTCTFWYNPTGFRGVPSPVYLAPRFNNIFTTTGFNQQFDTFIIFGNWATDSIGNKTFIIFSSLETYINPTVDFPEGNLKCFLDIASTAQALVPSSPLAVGIEWDCTGTTWVGRIFINGADVTDYTKQAADSFVMDQTTSVTTSGTDMGAPLDPAKVFQIQKVFSGNDYYFLGTRDESVFETNEIFELSHLWVLCESQLRLANDWDKFFDINNAPVDLGADGTLPSGRKPIFYFPHSSGQAGVNEGMLGDINQLTVGTITNATTIPSSGAYQAVGLRFAVSSYLRADNPLTVKNPETTGCDVWGFTNVWISTDQGQSYTLAGVIEGPSPVGITLTSFPSHTDPDTVDTLSLDVGYSQQPLPTVAQVDADNLLSLCVLTDGFSSEFISYETSTLVDTWKYNLTYLRRGGYFSGISSWNSGTRFARLDSNIFKFHYTSSMIGKTIYYKLQPSNGQGAGTPELDTLPYGIYTLRGPNSLNPPPVLQATESAGTVTLAWPIGLGCSIAGYDVGLAVDSSYTASTFNKSTITFWLDPIDPGATGVGHIICNIIDFGGGTFPGSIIDVYYNQDALGASHTGKYVVSYKITTLQSSVVYILWTTTTLQDFSNGPVAVGIVYDGSGTTWSAKILINGVDVTDTSFQAAHSSHGGTPGLAMGAVMTGSQSWPIDFGTGLWIGAVSDKFPSQGGITFDNSAYGVSQLWIGAGQTFDLTNPTNWAKFFDGSNQPVLLGAQGEIPTGEVPLYYYPSDPTEPTHSSGKKGLMDFKQGGFNTDTQPTGLSTSMIVGNQSAMGQESPPDAFGYEAKRLNALTLSITSLTPANYNFQVRSVNSLGFTSAWTTTNFTVT